MGTSGRGDISGEQVTIRLDRVGKNSQFLFN